MKLTKIIAMGALACTLFMVACQSKVEMAPAETFEITGKKITFTPPKDNWGKKRISSIPRESDSKVQKSDTVISFSPDMPGSSLTISGLSDWPQESWEADQQATNDFTRQVQDRVLKRTNGEIIKQQQTKLGDAVALELEIKYLEGTTAMHGKQLYAISDRTMWMVAMNLPEDKWDENASIYDQVVSSWKF